MPYSEAERGIIGRNTVYRMEKNVPISAIIPTLIAVSSSLAFIIGATVAIAAAPHITFPTPVRREMVGLAVVFFASYTMNAISMPMTNESWKSSHIAV